MSDEEMRVPMNEPLGQGDAGLANESNLQAAAGGVAAGAGEGANVKTIPGPVVRDLTDDTFAEALEQSKIVPFILDMWAPWCGPCRQLGPVLERAVEEAGGRVVLAKVNVDENPAIGQAFRVQSIPAVFLMIDGHPAPLFTGAVPASAVKQVIDKVLELAAEEGVTGRVDVTSDAGNPAESKPEEPELDLQLQAALDLEEDGDYEQAVEVLESYLMANPGEAATVEPMLAKARLGARAAAQGAESVAAVEHGNAADVTDVAAQLAAADAEMNAGDAAGALSRLLAVVAETSGEDREAARSRMVEYFGILGDDPLVPEMRSRLATLLY